LQVIIGLVSVVSILLFVNDAYRPFKLG